MVPARAQLVPDGGTGTINGTSTNITGSLTIGTNGSFTSLIITNAGAVTNTGSGSDGFIGYNSTSKSNQVIVSGSNSFWRCGQDVEVGYNGSYNLLLITNGGKVHDNTGYLGRLTVLSTNNVAIVTGMGSLWTNNNAVEVGGNGSFNTLLITNGGKVDTDETRIGNNGRSNQVLVTGTNSQLRHHNTGGSGNLIVGNQGSFNQLAVTDGGLVANDIGLIGSGGGDSNNFALVSGAGSVWTNSSNLRVGYRASFSWMLVTNGGKVVSADGFIGNNFTSSNNLAVVTGTSSLWTNRGDLYIGNLGSFNRLIVTNAGTVVAFSNLYVGYDPASSNNSVTLSGGNLIVTNAADTRIVDVRRGALSLDSGSLRASRLLLTNGVPSGFDFNGGTLQTKAVTCSNGALFVVGNGSSSATLELLTGGTSTFADGLQISANALLKGNGTILGNVTNASGGTLAPGASIGKLTINGNLVLAAGSTNIFEISKTANTNDNIVGLTSVTYGGTLVVTNLSGTLVGGENFKLFTASSYSGTFSSISLPALNPGLAWTNKLLVDGSIEVVLLTPEIAVQQPAGTDLTDGLSSVDFGSGLVGANSQRTFTITNSGSGNLTGLGIAIDGASAADFTVTANPTAPVSAGGSTTFTVTFTPGAAGARMAALHLASNDSDENPFDITLTGMGVTPLQMAQQAYAKASNTGTNDSFGYSVAVSGDTVVVGAPYEDSNATGVNGDQSNNSAPGFGAAYVFVRSGTNWVQQAYLKASNTGTNDSFGYSVAISGDTVVVGALLEDSNAIGVNGNQNDNSAIDSGVAYVFVRSGTNWTQQAYLKASNTGTNDWFGYSVTISSDTIVVSAPVESSNATGVNGNQSDNSAFASGAAYVFVRSGTNWTQQAYLKASNTELGDVFGASVAAAGDTVVVGAYQEDSNATGVNGNQSDNSAGSSGAVYIFVRNGTNWSQQAYFKASNTEGGDQFGLSVAVSGDTVLVGAEREDSNATGVNDDQSNNSAVDSGAAYVFVRNGTNWTQQAYLKPSNTGGSDYFAQSVGISGDTAVIGALFEDSNAIGVNGDQSNNTAVDSGAAYVFVRSGTNWFQHAYLKASNTGTNDWFGYSVAISGDTVVVGAYQEDSNATGVNGDGSNNSAVDSGTAYIFTFQTQVGIGPDGSGGYFLRFDGVPGLTYRLERAPSLTGPWTTIDTQIAPASGVIEYHETTPPPGQAYYRTVTP